MSENNFEKFLDAVRRGDVQTFGKLYQKKWIETKSNSGLWPIHFACIEGHVDIVSLLLDRHCQIEAADEEGYRPIHWACDKGHVDVVQLLLNSGCEVEAADEEGYRPIHVACDEGHVHIVKLLLDKKCQIEAEVEVGYRPIHLACDKGHVDIVQLLLNSGCKVEVADEKGYRPIHLASIVGNFDIVQLLLDTNCQIEVAVENGYRPIHLACIVGHANIVQLLLDRGCQSEATDEEQNRPIHWACERGHADIVKLLLDRDCQIGAANKVGLCPIHIATKKGHLDVVQMLLARGCEIDARTKDRKTALDLAKYHGKYECANTIKKALETVALFAAVRKDDLKKFDNILQPLWTKEPKTRQTLLDVIIQANAKSIIEFIRDTPISDKDINDFLSLNRNEFSNQSYTLLHQWLLQCCIRHKIDWAFLRLCSAEVVNSGPLPDGTTCLDTAVEHRRTLCVRHILQKYLAYDDSWDRARRAAKEKGYEEVIELIRHRQIAFQRNISMGRNRLHMAVAEDDLDMVEYILHKRIVDYSDTNKNGDNALMMAVANRMDECADAIRQHGADLGAVNKHGQTVLHAAVSGRMDMLPDWLIDNRCNVEQQDCMGLTALHQAVVANLHGLAEQLVRINADYRSVIRVNLACPRFKNDIFKSFPNPHSEHLELTSKENSSSLCLKLHGRIYPCFMDNFTRGDANFFDRNNNSLLHLMSLLMDADGCNRLLEKGAAVNAVNKHKNTPLKELLLYLLHCQRDNSIDDKVLMTVRCLVDGGANVSDEDDDSDTALQMAMELLDERLLLEMVRHDPPIKKMTLDEFVKCVENGMFICLEKIVPNLPKKLLEEYITTDAISQCSLAAQYSTVKTLFIHANPGVQEENVGQILYEAACRNDVEYFSDILRQRTANWKQMPPDGESILTVLIKEKRLRFCEMLVESESISNLLELTDSNNNSALMVAIEADAEKLIDRLIVDIKDVDCENTAGCTALSMLLEKVSSITGEKRNQMKLQIKHLINASADIYHVNRHKKMALSFCTSDELRKEFMTYHNKHAKQDPQRSQGCSMSPTAEETVMCGVCMDRKVNRVLDCGHTLCKECADNVFACPFCRAEGITPRRLLLP